MVERMQEQAVEQVKKPYVTPELTEYGSVELETQVRPTGGSNQLSF